MEFAQSVCGQFYNSSFVPTKPLAKAQRIKSGFRGIKPRKGASKDKAELRTPEQKSAPELKACSVSLADHLQSKLSTPEFIIFHTIKRGGTVEFFIWAHMGRLKKSGVPSCYGVEKKITEDLPSLLFLLCPNLESFLQARLWRFLKNLFSDSHLCPHHQM